MNKLGLILILYFPIGLLAQNIDYGKIILPESISQISFEERLVQLAWKNHPTNKIAETDVMMSNRVKNHASLTWLDNFSGTFNANEFTLNPSADILNRAAFYPKYNFSLRFTLGDFALIPIQTKIANDQLIISNLHVNERKLLVRKDILSGLEEFKERYKILRLRERLREDFLVQYRETEKRFSLGEVTIDQYQLAAQSYYGRSEAVINSQSVFNVSKISLESLIGIKLEDVTGYSNFLAQLESEITIDR